MNILTKIIIIGASNFSLLHSEAPFVVLVECSTPIQKETFDFPLEAIQICELKPTEFFIDLEDINFKPFFNFSIIFFSYYTHKFRYPEYGSSTAT